MPPDFTFGVEIECYLPEGGDTQQAAAAVTARLGEGQCHAETYSHITRGHWKIVPDGSLRDFTRGMELVSPVLRGEAGLIAVERVMDALNDYGCTVARSCGLHVHVGVGAHPTMQFWRNLLKLYGAYEPVIDRFMPPSRRQSQNSYCRSITSLPFASIDRAQTLAELRALFPAERRYHKVNLEAYSRYATVEFRQHSGTLEGIKARSWIMFCLRMVDAAAQNRTGFATTTIAGTQINRARPGSKTYMVGQMMLRPEGVTGPEAMAATGWHSISLLYQAKVCGLSFTTRRTGRMVRYFAQAAAASVATTNVNPTLDNLLNTLECTEAECAYFRARTANLSGPVQWAA